MKYAGEIEKKYKDELGLDKNKYLDIIIPKNSNFITSSITNYNNLYQSDNFSIRQNNCDLSKINYPYNYTFLFASFLFFLTCCYIIMLFGIKFTGQKASYWLLSSFISTVSDILVFQPIQIITKTFFCNI